MDHLVDEALEYLHRERIEQQTYDAIIEAYLSGEDLPPHWRKAAEEWLEDIR